MLVVSKISKRYRTADEFVLRDISFTVNAGERVGIVGKNGAGKSTLMRIIASELQPDSGNVQLVGDARLGYLPQGILADDDTPLIDILYPHLHQLQTAEDDVERLAAAMTTADDVEIDEIMAKYGDALERLEHLSQYITPADGEQIMAGLGLSQFDLDTPVSILSGGQKTRLGLASLLLHNPDLLLLDEPTNHLDITALEWLEAWLSEFDGGVLIISHDRTFLDKTVNSIVHIDDKTHTAQHYDGNYRDYVQAVQTEQDKQWAQWRDQQVEIARLTLDIQKTMARAVRKENATKNDQQRRYAKKVAKRAKAKETRLNRYLESEDRVDKPEQHWDLKLDFGDLPTTGRDVIYLEDLSIGYEKDHPLVEHINLNVQAGERVIVLGENGAGKSTLIKTIMDKIPSLNGRIRIGASVQVGYLAQEQDFLDPDSNPLETLLGEAAMSHTDARSFLHYFLFAGDDVFQPIHSLSYGERTRLMLAILVARGANVLILDEPINHLDIPSRELFEKALSAFEGSVIAVVHDRYFVDKFATTVWEIADGKVQVDIRHVLA